MKTKGLVLTILIVLSTAGFFIYKTISQPAVKREKIIPVTEERGSAEIHDQNISGEITRDQIWSGKIHVTGDVWVKEGITLTILPGTVIRVVAFSDDQHGGIDHPHDPPFPKDPDRIETKSVQFTIKGTLNAVGTPDRKIIFTSNSEQPTTYDWDGLYISRGRLEYAIVEYARYNNIQESSDVIISNSVFKNSLEDCLGIGHDKPISPQILNNEFYNCGHEGIDNGGGSAIIKGNYFHLENPEIQPDPSTGGHGVVVYQNSYPVIENNRFEKLRYAVILLAGPIHKKDEKKKVIIKNNTMKNNDAAFFISPGYPTDSLNAIVRKNNNLIDNKQEEIKEQ